MFMGNGWGGKTSVLRTLAKQPLQRSLAPTRSVTIDALHKDLRPGWVTKFKKLGFDVDLSYWDFAGQLEYSLAHQHFMSTRQAVYVVVFSVQDDDDSIAQQLIHWLSIIPDPAACPHIRLIILGTKIDLVPTELLTSVLEAKRKVVQLVIEQKELVCKIQTEDIIFVSSDMNFADPLEPSRNWAICRRGLKNRIYHHCTSIFAGDEQQRFLKYPTACKELRKLVDVLLRELCKKQSLPCCRLDDADAVKILSSILEMNDDDHQRSTYFQTDLVKMALEVLNDLGLIVLYGHGGISQKMPSVCLEPQFLSNIMSVLVESKTAPAVTTADALIELMEQHQLYSRISPQSSRGVKESLVELLESVGIVRRCSGGQKLIVPLALKGRPQCWSDIKSKSLPNCVFFALRLGVRKTAFVSSTMFMEVMAAKCADEHRMWGCAFAYDCGDELGTIRIFVRLKEDRRSVDIVAVMPNVQGGLSIVHRKVLDEVESIALILGEEFSGDSERMLLCPMCCSSNMFVRFGAAHAFHLQQVACGGLLRCSRFHEIHARDVTDGKMTNLDLNALPLVHPGRLHELQLPWKQVDECGILYNSAVMNNPQHVVGTTVANTEEQADSLSSAPKWLLSRHAGEPDVSLSTKSLLHGAHAVVTSSSSIEAVHSPDSAATSPTEGAFHDGVFTQVSFFVITGQVSIGDTIAADDMPAFRHFLSVCDHHDCCCNVKLTSGESKTLKFSFNVGDKIPNPISEKLPILSIWTMPLRDTIDRQQHTKQRFCAHDNVIVVFSERLESTPYVKPIYLLFPGRCVGIYCRLTPSLCRTDTNAACCWSELQASSSPIVLSIVSFIFAFRSCSAGPHGRYDGSRA
jgi:GTPase SAR1 family protein